MFSLRQIICLEPKKNNNGKGVKMKDKILMIKTTKGNIQIYLNEYLTERKADIINFYSFGAYLRAILDTSIIDKERREETLKALTNQMAEYFWTGVYIGKTKPEIVNITYETKKEEDNQKVNYLG